jgi:hypothetical protein
MIERSIGERLSKGGYVVSFISNDALQSPVVMWELEEAARQWPDRILPALLEPVDLTALPAVLRKQAPVVLYQETGREHALNWNGIDDLIVRIYHLVHRNSRRGGE